MLGTRFAKLNLLILLASTPQGFSCRKNRSSRLMDCCDMNCMSMSFWIRMWVSKNMLMLKIENELKEIVIVVVSGLGFDYPSCLGNQCIPSEPLHCTKLLGLELSVHQVDRYQLRSPRNHWLRTNCPRIDSKAADWSISQNPNSSGYCSGLSRELDILSN